jgi:hypothetical protein
MDPGRPRRTSGAGSAIGSQGGTRIYSSHFHQVSPMVGVDLPASVGDLDSSLLHSNRPHLGIGMIVLGPPRLEVIVALIARLLAV